MPWVLGAALSIFGSVASNLGVNIQKYSFIRQAHREPHQRTSHWKDLYWLAGLGLVVFGSLGDFAALSMVAQSIVAPLASTTLVTNVVFAHFWLHEAVGRREIIGTAFIILGSTLAVVFGDHNSRSYTNDELVALFGGGWFLAYAILVAILCLVGLALHRKITPIKKNLVEAIRRYELAVEANDSQGAEWEDEVIARLEKEYKQWEKLHPFALCALSGAFGAQSVLFGKMVAELLSTSFDGHNQFFNIFPYVAIICMITTVASQLHFLAVALNYFDALYAVPVFQCFFIGVSTLGGALYFREVYDMKAGEAVAFVLGLLLTLAGVAVLSTRQMSQRNIVHRVAQDAQLVKGSSQSNLLANNANGDEEKSGDDNITGSTSASTGTQEDGGLLRRGVSSLRHARTGSTHMTSTTDGPLEFEMADYTNSKRSSLTSTTPILKASSALPNFSEKAQAEQKEINELAETLDSTTAELRDKLLARVGYGPLAGTSHAKEMSTSEKPQALLHHSTAASSSSSAASALSNSALAIQIEADQAYINRLEEHQRASGLPISAAGRKIKQQQLASAASASQQAAVPQTRYDTDLEILSSIPASLNEGSPRLSAQPHHTSTAFDYSSASARSGMETPRSVYVTERLAHAQAQQAQSAAASMAGSMVGTTTNSGRNSPQVNVGTGTGSGGTNTPRLTAAATPGSTTTAHDGSPHTSVPSSPAHGAILPTPSSSSSGKHARGFSNVSGRGGVVGTDIPPPLVKHMSSAMFSGAFLESAQELPDVDSDTRLQRLTRLSTVGHWVAGLHAQMPVAGGVVQAILQANEMRAALEDEETKLKAVQGKVAGLVPPTPAAAGASSSSGSSAPPTPAMNEKLAPGAALEEHRIEMPIAHPVDMQLETNPDTLMSSAKPSPAMRPTDASLGATVSSSSLTASSNTTPTTTAVASSTTAASSDQQQPPVNRIITFDDDADPFSTQSSSSLIKKKLQHRDPFADLSPTEGFERLKKDLAPPSSSSSSSQAAAAADHASLTAAAAARLASEQVMFSPLHAVSKHPLATGTDGLASPGGVVVDPTSAHAAVTASSSSSTSISAASLDPEYDDSISYTAVDPSLPSSSSAAGDQEWQSLSQERKQPDEEEDSGEEVNLM